MIESIQIAEKTFKSLALGELPIADWQFQLLLIFLGSLLRILLRIKNREEQKPLSIKFWIKSIKNWSSLLLSIILAYVLVRFYGEYEKSIQSFIPDNFEASIYGIMFGLGFFMHKISYWFSKLITPNRN